MSATLSDPALLGMAGRFVWLELDYDKPVNQKFIARRGVQTTPSLYVLDPGDERVTATHLGGLTVLELIRFLERGERGFRENILSPATSALARGDRLLGIDHRTEAAGAYREALGLAAPGSPERSQAVTSLTWTLWQSGDYEHGAQTAEAEAPGMARGEPFARIVLAGLGSANRGGEAPWAEASRKVLEPLAEEAVGLQATMRDHRYQLYQQLMIAADLRRDQPTVQRWGHRWLDEMDGVIPKDDDERSALDIARVDAAMALGEPARVIPALEASVNAMPSNYNASLRLAQVDLAAAKYDETLTACRRSLAHVTGPSGRTWILKIEAKALIGKGDNQGARHALEQALRSARKIGNLKNRERMVRAISQQLEKAGNPVR